MEESSCPGHTSPTSIQSYHPADPDPTRTSDSDSDSNSGREAKPYTFSEQITYESAAEDDFGDEVTSYALDSQPLKRPKTSTTILDHHRNLDLISTLPDTILLHILSFLPTEHAVATGVLSKRWHHLWTAVPTLVFRHWSWRHSLDRFVDFVDKTLFLYGCAHVKKFHLSLEFHMHFQSRVFGWLHFVTRHKVDDLKLDFYQYYADEDDMFPWMVNLYKLPQFIYKYELLKKLNLSFCKIKPKGSINWKLLKNLSISYAKLSDDLVGKILKGAPVLESLELYKCSGIRRLNVESASLGKLVINDNCDSGDVLEISGPNLQSLGIFGILQGKTCRVRNVASLVDVTLNFQQYYNDDNDYGDFPYMLVDLDHADNEDYQKMLRGILENIEHVKKLTIGSWCIEVLAMCEMKELPSPLSKRTQLVLNTCLYSRDLLGIVSLLFSSPDLERLVINVAPSLSKGFEFEPYSPWTCNFDAEKFLNSKNMISNNSLLSLKYIKVVGFNAKSSRSKFVIALMEFLLGNARVLERMVICASRPEDCHIVVQRLLNFPRSSPHAEVVLKGTKYPRL